MNDEQVNKIEELLVRSELGNRSQELMRQFFNSISNTPQFDKIIYLLDKFPSVFENFCQCFELNKKALESGITDADWNILTAKQRELFGSDKS